MKREIVSPVSPRLVGHRGDTDHRVLGVAVHP